MFRTIVYTLSLFILISSAACSKYRSLLKSTDYELKLEKAVEYYGKEDYYKALQLLEELVPYYRGKKEAETVNYYYAYCYYKQQDYILASYFFKRFSSEFPTSKHSEECFFLNAYSKFLDSPVYSLDQTSSYEAIRELQLFVNYFPLSDSIPRCNDLIDELRGKLQKKDFEIAKLYYKTENYLAAITAFKNVLKDYPETNYKEDILFLIIKTNYNYAINSIPSKQKERYNNTLDAYNEFIVYYPESKFISDAKAYFEHSIKELETINN